MHHELGKFVRGLLHRTVCKGRKFRIGLQQGNRCFQIVRGIGPGQTGRGEIILPERMKGLLADQSFMGSLALSVRLVIRVDELVQTVEQFVDHDRWWYRLVPPDGLSHVTQVEKFTGAPQSLEKKITVVFPVRTVSGFTLTRQVEARIAGLTGKRPIVHSEQANDPGGNTPHRSQPAKSNPFGKKASLGGSHREHVAQMVTDCPERNGSLAGEGSELLANCLNGFGHPPAIQQGLVVLGKKGFGQAFQKMSPGMQSLITPRLGLQRTQRIDDFRELGKTDGIFALDLVIG